MNDRRMPDPRIDDLQGKVEHLHDCVEGLKLEMKKNTEVTEQVRDILASFRIAGAIAKWIGGMAGAAAGVWAFMKGFRS
jgi:hypothetical protein